MGRHAYADFDEFADAIDGLAGRFVPTARSNGEWWIDKMGLRGHQLQYLQVGGATTFAGDGTPGTITLGIPMTDPATLRSDGQPLAENTFNLIIQNQPFTCSSRSLSRWAAVAVQQDKLAKREPFLDSPMPGGARTQTEKSLLDNVRSLVLRIWSDDQAVSIVDPAAQAAVEDEMMHAVTNVLQASNRANDRHIGRPQVSRTKVIAHCLELIDASEGQPLFIDDLCSATQVSERTLRNIFQEYFGVGPMRLLKVRQLREIRSALLRGDPVADTVTKIAARFGVWDFSLFARNYRALYGEAPSQTLRRPRDRGVAVREDEGLTPTWIAFAARQFAVQQPMQGSDGSPMRIEG
jgi:AraC family ethanolamine operon transcriptional activator